MQYDIDIKSKHAKNFKTIRKILLSYSEIIEVKNAKQNSYKNQYGVVIMMRTKGDVLVVAFGKGFILQEKYPQLEGSGKIVRHLYFKEDDSVDEALLREMIDESLVLSMEMHEMKLIRSSLNSTTMH